MTTQYHQEYFQKSLNELETSQRNVANLNRGVDHFGESTTMATTTTTTNITSDTSTTGLEAIAAKTTAIFECMRMWLVMDPGSVLTDPSVCKIVFSAIEAALIGTIPSGPWQEQVEYDRRRRHCGTVPLLFLGLQMRASLLKDNHVLPLKVL